MKFLILTVTTGQGHNQTASAIKNEVIKNGSEAEILDVLELISSALKLSVSKGYLFSTSVSPRAYGKFYRAAEKKDPDGLLNFQTLANSKKVTEYINSQKPDVIICTHVIAAFTFKKSDLCYGNVKTVGIITDFTIHPYWNETSLDYYIIPNEKLCYQGALKGLPGELLPFGIPVMPVFSEKTDKKTAREALNIPDKKTILVMSGSMGYGKVYKNLIRMNAMSEDFQIISVCGNNEDLKKKIDRKNLKKVVINYGYTNNVPLLMDAADLIITKPGGITVSEALAKELPIIIANPIPGHEERNCEFLLNTGVAMKVSNTCPPDEVISMVINDEERLENLKNNIKSIKKPNAAKSLVEFLKKD